VCSPIGTGRGFRDLLGGLYGRDSLRQRGDDAPVLLVGLALRLELIAWRGYHEVRPLGRVVGVLSASERRM
jgi:hypothetical protein